jgi:hypothetical protein
MKIAHTLLTGAVATLCMSSLALADGTPAAPSAPVTLTAAPIATTPAVAVPALAPGEVPAVPPPAAAPPVAPLIVPANTPLALHLTAPVSSNGSKSGSTFGFVTVEPVIVGGKTVVAAGATGTGTLILAGHAGWSGHEGDLTLRFDSVQTVDGQQLQLNDQRVEINGRNRKVIALIAGFVPYAGMAAGFIRGSEMSIAPTTVIHTIIKKDASTGIIQAKM